MQTEADTCTKPHNWCLNVSTQNWGILLWIPTHCCTPTRPYHRLCEKIEFQMRGSPHAHCLLWVKDGPKVDKDPDDIVCAFIDKYITSVIPPIAPKMKIISNWWKTYKNMHILTTVVETNLVVLVFQTPMQQKP